MAMTRRSFIEVVGLGALSLAGMGMIAGCGGSPSTGGTGAKGASGSSGKAASSKLQTIKDRGKLKCGVKADVKGYGLLNTKTNKYEGLEIDLCYQLAAAVLGGSYDDAKKKDLCEFTTVTPKTRGPLIDNDTLDVICATYTITPKRQKDWDFSEPYRTDYVGVMVMKSSGIAKMSDLSGKVIGVSQGSTTKDAVVQMLKDQKIDAQPQFKEFPDYPSINSALESGNVDAFAMDRSTLTTYMNDKKELVQPEIKFGKQDYGVATKKGSDLSKVVNDTVKKLKDEGWFDEEVKTWNLL